MIQAIDAVDATIKLFQPDMDIGIIRVRPTRRCHTAFRGESSRMILNMLREGHAPMTTRDIVLAVMTARGLNATGKVMHETMRLRVGASLRVMRDRGRVVSGEGHRASLLWNLAVADD